MTSNIIVFSEDSKIINDALHVAYSLSEKTGNLIALTNSDENAEEYFRNFDEVYVTKKDLMPDQWASLLRKVFLEKNANYVIAPHTVNNNDILSFLSAKEGMHMVSNALSFQEKGDYYVFSRQVIGGRGISYIEISKNEKIALTVPLKVYPKINLNKSPLVKEITEIPNSKINFAGFEERKRSGVNIENADIVIGVGRGFKNKEDLKLAQELADAINGVVGCSRPIAADYGWLPNDLWIGISSKIIKPKLYIAVGISGAPQHVSGIMDSKVIVAINKDKNASIFKYADYGVVADLYQFLPTLTKKIKEMKK
jgi:Electron transfer flavoprotein, alpha subunit